VINLQHGGREYDPKVSDGTEKKNVGPGGPFFIALLARGPRDGEREKKSGWK